MKNNNVLPLNFSYFVYISIAIHILTGFYYLKTNPDFFKRIFAEESIIEFEIKAFSPPEKKRFPAQRTVDVKAVKKKTLPRCPKKNMPSSIREKTQVQFDKERKKDFKKTKKRAQGEQRHKKVLSHKRINESVLKKVDILPDKIERVCKEEHRSGKINPKPTAVPENPIRDKKAVLNDAVALSMPLHNNNKGLKQKYIQENFLYIRELILGNLSYPVAARRMKWQGIVVVSFSIMENGRVASLKIVKSSGYKVLDDKAVATIEKVQPFPVPPVKAGITMPIKFTLGRS